MKNREHILIQLLLSATLFVAAALALEITPVGTIDDNLFAPTSLHVENDELAVLEPYSEQLKIFTADGVFSHQVDVTGDAFGLVKVSPWLYLYCDRDRRQVVAVHAINGAQYDYFPGRTDLVEPVDLIVTAPAIWVLDAGTGSILRFDESNGSRNRVDIIETGEAPVRYFSSFAYDISRERFYILDQINSQILTVTADGQVIGHIGQFGNADGEITRGGEVAVDSDGRVYVSDRFQGRVTVFSPDGRFLDDIDPFDGAAAVPTGITIDQTGVLYVASTMGTGIRMFFVAAAPSLDESIRLVQRFPEVDAVLAVDDVRLAAITEQGEATNDVSGFDFQIFADTLGVPVAEVRNVTPTVESSSNTAIRITSAEWTPDTTLADNQSYYWRTRVRSDIDLGSWSDLRLFHTLAIPKEFRLDQNFPNPFNPRTRISFVLPVAVELKLSVFNLLGQRVKTLAEGVHPAGSHSIDWDGTNDDGQAVSTGVYFYRLEAGDYVQTRKMVLIK